MTFIFYLDLSNSLGVTDCVILIHGQKNDRSFIGKDLGRESLVT